MLQGKNWFETETLQYVFKLSHQLIDQELPLFYAEEQICYWEATIFLENQLCVAAHLRPSLIVSVSKFCS